MMSVSSEAELAEYVAAADAPIRVIGGGTRGVVGTQGALSVAGVSGVELYEPGALTLVVKAGTPVAEVEALLAKSGQRLPFEPMDHRVLTGQGGTPTVGGMVAANVSGPRRFQAGACRDSLIGVRFVDGRGEVIRNGGRVMKNVTGYDLVKLMAGSFGTLGILTEVAFKVLPMPETGVTLILRGLDDVTAIAALSRALGSPFEVNGATHAPVGMGGAPETLLRLEGFAGSVAYRTDKLRALLADFGAVEVVDDTATHDAIWAWVRDVRGLAGGGDDIWRVSVKPSDGPAVAAAARPNGALYDWGGGLVWLRVAPGTDVRARLGGIAGHATIVRASAETRAQLGMFHPEPAPVAALTRGVRQQFDPKGLFNPGLMG